MRRPTGFIMTALAAAVAGTAAHAQEPQREFEQQPQQQQQDQWRPGQQDRDQMRQRMQQMQMMMLHHADDEIVNASVTNLQQENLGNVSALVVDMQSGQVTYAIVSFGGFLGIGDTLHAVPWNAFIYRPLYDGLVLDVSQAQLEQQQGFTRDQLPNFDDQQWGQQLHQQYGTQPYWEQRRQPRWMDDDRPRGRLQSLQQPQRQPQRPQQPRPQQPTDEPMYPGMTQQFITTYDLIGMNVENRQGENVGTIRDFAIDLRTGEIEHVVMGYGGWLGMGETNTALPLQAFEPRNFGTDDAVMILDITQDQLRGAPEYRLDRWPRRDAGNWAQNIGTQPAR